MINKFYASFLISYFIKSYVYLKDKLQVKSHSNLFYKTHLILHVSVPHSEGGGEH